MIFTIIVHCSFAFNFFHFIFFPILLAQRYRIIFMYIFTTTKTIILCSFVLYGIFNVYINSPNAHIMLWPTPVKKKKNIYMFYKVFSQQASKMLNVNNARAQKIINSSYIDNCKNNIYRICASTINNSLL